MKDVEKKVLYLLHLARKAGKLQFGFDACQKSCFCGQAKLIIYVTDLADKTRKRVLDMTDQYKVRTVEIGTKKMFGEAFSKRDLGVISIEDNNFANGIMRLVV